MKRKTVAARAAELGLDQKDLVQALKLLSVRRTKSDGYYPRGYRGRYWRGRKLVPRLSHEQAAAALGIDSADALQQIKLSYPHQWTRAEILDALFAFYAKHGRWPVTRELRLRNDLPPYRQWQWMAAHENWSISARDQWERWIARDKRCTPQMALELRNVLARKEAIDRFGFETLIKKKLATVRDDDPEWGTLYELPGEMPKEPMVLLKVLNSTAEPDGTFASYYLRVPPSMTTAREAVRWTFGGDETLGSQLYEPLVQT